MVPLSNSLSQHGRRADNAPLRGPYPRCSIVDVIYPDKLPVRDYPIRRGAATAPLRREGRIGGATSSTMRRSKIHALETAPRKIS